MRFYYVSVIEYQYLWSVNIVLFLHLLILITELGTLLLFQQSQIRLQMCALTRSSIVAKIEEQKALKGGGRRWGTMMIRDGDIEAKEAAVREVAKLLPLPESLASITTIRADYALRQQVSISFILISWLKWYSSWRIWLAYLAWQSDGCLRLHKKVQHWEFHM